MARVVIPQFLIQIVLVRALLLVDPAQYPVVELKESHSNAVRSADYRLACRKTTHVISGGLILTLMDPVRRLVCRFRSVIRRYSCMIQSLLTPFGGRPL